MKTNIIFKVMGLGKLGRLLSLAAILGGLGSLAGCASSPYYGGAGSVVTPSKHVPREVQRTEPWLPVL